MRAKLQHSLAAAAIILSLLAWGCGGSSAPPPPPSNVSITIFPDSTTVQVNTTQRFIATVTGTSNTMVSWTVNGIPGGNSTIGTISSTGLYMAPTAVPNPSTTTVAATAQADASKSAPASVLILAQGVGNVNQARQNPPIELGTSGGNQNDQSTSGNTVTCCSGTLGALVMRGGIRYILSNNHVLARNDQAATGEVVMQPGLADTNCTANGNTVAHLSQFAPLRTSNADAAIAEVVSGAVDSAGGILLFGAAGGSAPPASSTVSPAVGMSVAKSGRSTGLTCSPIEAINAKVSVQYQQGCGSGTKFAITFNNQVVVSGAAFSASGDSGSLIVNAQTVQPVALLFGGGATNTVANPIQDVLNALKDPTSGAVPSLVGGGQHAIACPASPAAAALRASALSEAATAMATAVKDKHAQELMADPAVIGVDIGVSDDQPGQPALLVYVEQGRPHAPLPAEVDGVRTKVIFADRFRALTAGLQAARVAQPAQALSDAEVARATSVKEKHAAQLMADPSVIGVGVGASSDSPGEAALVLYIELGKPVGVVPTQIDGVRTKVIRADRFRAFGWNEKPTRTCGLNR